MADFERRERFDNAIIDLSDMTITEYTDCDTKCYDLMNLLKRWDGVVGINLTVKAKLFCPEIAGLFCRIAGLFCHDSRANLSLKPVCFGIAIS